MSKLDMPTDQWMASETSSFMPAGVEIVWAKPEEMDRLRITARMDRQDLARNMCSLRAAGKSTGTLDDLANI